VVVAAFLALGGTLAERLASSAGLNPKPAPAATTPTTATAPALNAPLAAFLGVVHLSPTPAPPIALADQSGDQESLGRLQGKVVVVTFFDADCADACPVLAADIREADKDLGADRSRVVFITVNSDPLLTISPTASAALDGTGLAALGNWQFLSGSLPALDEVWRNYGVTINVSPSSGMVAHNNLMYFIDPNGDLRIRATPVADETANGSYSLPPASIRRSGAGIAEYATSLLPGRQ